MNHFGGHIYLFIDFTYISLNDYDYMVGVISPKNSRNSKFSTNPPPGVSFVTYYLYSV